MSIISTIAELFRRSAIPSIESTIGQGGSRERAIENLRNLIGPDVTISQQTIGTALSRIQQAMQRGSAIQRGETVPRQLIPIDPTIPIGTEYRYRIRVSVDIPNPLNPSDIQTVDIVVPVDSETALSLRELNERARQVSESIAPRERSPKLRTLGNVMRTQEIIRFTSQVISVYRSPIG